MGKRTKEPDGLEPVAGNGILNRRLFLERALAAGAGAGGLSLGAGIYASSGKFVDNTNEFKTDAFTAITDCSVTGTGWFLDDVRIPGANLLGGKARLDARLARARREGCLPRPRPG